MKKIFLLLALILNLHFVLATEKLTQLDICFNKLGDSYGDHQSMRCYIAEANRIKKKIKNKMRLIRKGHNYFHKGEPLNYLNEEFFNHQVGSINLKCELYKTPFNGLGFVGTLDQVESCICEVDELNLFDKFISKYVNYLNK